MVGAHRRKADVEHGSRVVVKPNPVNPWQFLCLVVNGLGELVWLPGECPVVEPLDELVVAPAGVHQLRHWADVCVTNAGSFGLKYQPVVDDANHGLLAVRHSLQCRVHHCMRNEEVQVQDPRLVKVSRDPWRMAAIDVASVGYHSHLVDCEPQANPLPKTLKHFLAVGDEEAQVLPLVEASHRLEPPWMDKVMQRCHCLDAMRLQTVQYVRVSLEG
mmetsp:Transcript_38673/g.109352  ORF Transcript_38673/g.109352 Transcript_38673/m.109352 type:complete len:216 (+) Transcript_38673:917-1564(+)